MGGIVFHHQGSTFFTVDNMGVMIRLGQGGLRSLLKWPYAMTRLTAHIMYGLMSELVTCKFRKNMVIHDTKCPYTETRCHYTTQTQPCAYLSSEIMSWRYYFFMQNVIIKLLVLFYSIDYPMNVFLCVNSWIILQWSHFFLHPKTLGLHTLKNKPSFYW